MSDLAPIKAHLARVVQQGALSKDQLRSDEYLGELIGEVERLQRYEAMWQDCRGHRDQAEKRARRYMDIVAQVAELVAPDEDEGL